jgi:hypothetical protein
MRPFEILDTDDLINALADYTARHTKLLAEGGRQRDIITSREMIQSLINEIESRKAAALTEPASRKNT